MFSPKVIRILLFSSTLMLAACGQKGPLEPLPPAPETTPPQAEQASMPVVTTESGRD